MKVLLHICCGVCAAGAAEQLLSEGFEVTGYFYNPNIFPFEEYRRRLEASRKAAEELNNRRGNRKILGERLYRFI